MTTMNSAKTKDTRTASMGKFMGPCSKDMFGNMSVK